MVHLIIIRQMRSFIAGKDLIYGPHEELEKEIDLRKYFVQDKRVGCCIPTSSEWKFLDYRIKKEVVADFAKDLNVINLNPTPNKIKIKDIIISKGLQYNQEASTGKLILIIQYLFKWVNKKKLSFTILILLSIIFTSFFLMFLAFIILLNPLKPVPISDKPMEAFTRRWHTTFTIGLLEDPKEKLSNGEVQKDVL